MSTSDSISDEEFKNTLESLSYEAKKNVKILITIFLLGIALISYIIYSFPNLSENERDAILQFPKTAENLKIFVSAILVYSQKQFYHVLTLFIWIYIFLQSFAIPGTLAMSIIAGALYGKFWGLILVTIVAAFGACGCFMLSTSLSKYWVYKLFPSKIMYFKKSIENNKDNLFFYLLFLRITPLIPNWLLNLSTPIVGVPFLHFFFATVFGLIPANIIHVSMGSELANLETIGFDMRMLGILLFISLLALMPILIKKLLAKKFKEA